MENKVKYPRTLHLPYSENANSDDKVLLNDDHFKGKHVIVMEKLDGENTTIYKDYNHARSLDSNNDIEGRNWIAALRESISSKIPSNMRLCGENMFYAHTCEYKDLESMFYGCSIWIDDKCLSYSETIAIYKDLGIPVPFLIYEGPYDGGEILASAYKYKQTVGRNVEGFVIRVADSFKYDDFSINFAKFVYDDFVLPDIHWRFSTLQLNKLKDERNPWQIIGV